MIYFLIKLDYRYNKDYKPYEYIESDKTENKILLVYPHTVCINDDKKFCDYSSKKWGDILYEKLNEEKYNVDKLICLSRRIEGHDCNREEIKFQNKEFNRKLIELIKNENTNIIIDVHSQYSKNPYYLNFDEKLENFFNNKNTFEMKKASDKNYIINIAKQNNKPALLVEFLDHKEDINNEFIDDIMSKVKSILNQ